MENEREGNSWDPVLIVFWRTSAISSVLFLLEYDFMTVVD